MCSTNKSESDSGWNGVIAQCNIVGKDSAKRWKIIVYSHIKDNETMIMINVSVINNSLIIAYVISFIPFIIIN